MYSVKKIFLISLTLIILGGATFIIGVPRVTDILNEPMIVPSAKVKIFELPVPEISPSSTSEVFPGETKQELIKEINLKEAIKNAQQILEEIQPAREPREKIPQSEIYNNSLGKVVNLLCNAAGSEVIVVTGFLISERGHILSNAHISDPLDEKKCQVRQGSPAKTFALAEEVFRPTAYIEAFENENLQRQAENDISIWKITSSSGTKPLPSTFPYFKIDAKEKPEIGEVLVTLSYPSELLGFETILRSLSLLFTQTEVTDMDNTFILTKDTLSSQSGSSGGVLISQFTGQTVGIIFGVEKKEEISQRILFSLSTQAIERIIKNETGKTLEEFLLFN